MPSDRDERIGRLLTEAGLITAEELDRAQLHPRSRSEGLGAALSALGLLDESRLLSFLAEHYGVAQADLTTMQPDPALAEKVTFELCDNHTLVPLRYEGRILVVAMSDPGDLRAVDDLRFRVGAKIRPMIASSRAIRDAIQQIFPVKVERRAAEQDEVLHVLSTKGFAAVTDEDPEVETVLRLAYLEATSVEPATPEQLAAQLSPDDLAVVRLIQELLFTAVAEEVTHVRLDLRRAGFQVVFRKNDAWMEPTPLPPELRLRALWHVKTLCQLPIGPLTDPVQAPLGLNLGGDRVAWFRVFLTPKDDGPVVLLHRAPPEAQLFDGYDWENGGEVMATWWSTLQKGLEARHEAQLEEAEAHMTRATELADDLGARGRRPLADSLCQLAQTVDAAGRSEDARLLYLRALAIQQAEFGEDSPVLVQCLTGIAETHSEQEQWADAVTHYRQALSKTELAYGSEDLEVAWILERIAWACAEQGLQEEADACEREAAAIEQNLIGS